MKKMSLDELERLHSLSFLRDGVGGSIYSPTSFFFFFLKGVLGGLQCLKMAPTLSFV